MIFLLFVFAIIVYAVLAIHDAIRNAKLTEQNRRWAIARGDKQYYDFNSKTYLSAPGYTLGFGGDIKDEQVNLPQQKSDELYAIGVGMGKK